MFSRGVKWWDKAYCHCEKGQKGEALMTLMQ